MEKHYHEQFYYSQNLDMRKQIREYDLKLAQGDSGYSQCNFLAVGPPRVGKSSLLKY
jgi:tRNA U34 5-carboxymethylaminomethyl modifying GTPase MnmE/TrmE